jgi:hypothetical protein
VFLDGTDSDVIEMRRPRPQQLNVVRPVAAAAAAAAAAAVVGESAIAMTSPLIGH